MKLKTAFSAGEDHVALGPAGQERAEEAAARPHPGDGAQGRAGAHRAHQRRAHPAARAPPAPGRRRRLALRLYLIKK